MSETFYEFLGVPPDAPESEITAAYRERIKETHPDLSDAEDAEEQAKRVIEAKETLTDADERERYDRLGHDAYVNQTAVDADWRDTVDTESHDNTHHGPSTGGTDAGRREPGPGSGARSAYEGTWAQGTDETTGGSSDGADSETRSGTGAGKSATGTRRTNENPGATGGDQRRQRRSRGSNGSRNVGDAVGWAAGVNGQHAVRNGKRRGRLHRSRLFPPTQSLVLLVSTFLCYPALVFSTFFPAFPLVVNVVVGCCTLFLIAYLMSMPEVGTYVFGGWSLLATLGVLAYGVPVFSLLGILLLGTTWIPFAFTLLTYSVLRW